MRPRIWKNIISVKRELADELAAAGSCRGRTCRRRVRRRRCSSWAASSGSSWLVGLDARALLELVALDLARGAARKRLERDEADVLRLLVAGELGAAAGARSSSARRATSSRRATKATGHLAPLRVGARAPRPRRRRAGPAAARARSPPGRRSRRPILMRYLTRSTKSSVPSGLRTKTSPMWNQPPRKSCAFTSGALPVAAEQRRARASHSSPGRAVGDVAVVGVDQADLAERALLLGEARRRDADRDEARRARRAAGLGRAEGVGVGRAEQRRDLGDLRRRARGRPSRRRP